MLRNDILFGGEMKGDMTVREVYDQMPEIKIGGYLNEKEASIK